MFVDARPLTHPPKFTFCRWKRARQHLSSEGGMLGHDCGCSVALSKARPDFAGEVASRQPTLSALHALAYPRLVFPVLFPFPRFPSSCFLVLVSLSIIVSSFHFSVHSTVCRQLCSLSVVVFWLGGGRVTPFFTEVSLSRQGNMGSPARCSRLLFISGPAGLESPADHSHSALLLSSRFLFAG